MKLEIMNSNDNENSKSTEMIVKIDNDELKPGEQINVRPPSPPLKISCSRLQNTSSQAHASQNFFNLV